MTGRKDLTSTCRSARETRSAESLISYTPTPMPIIRAKNHVEEYRARALGKDIRLMSGRSDHERTISVAQHILAALPITEKTVLVDVGCGDGTLVSMVRANAIGVAPNEEEISRLRVAHPGREFVCAPAHRLPFPDGFADVLICNGVLLVLETEGEVRKALREFARVTKGHIFLGEVPTGPVKSTYATDSLHEWLLSLWHKNGLRGLFAGVKRIASAAIGSEVLYTCPDRWFYCAPEKLHAIADEGTMKVYRYGPTPDVPGRCDYYLSH